MKLRNKKTGEIAEPFGITCVNGRTFVQFDDEKGTFKFEAHSLAELNEEWEDYEEPKGLWAVGEFGELYEVSGLALNKIEKLKEIGNYFDTEEEAEKAVEKLKAWKRLKDKGAEFYGWRKNPTGTYDFLARWKDVPPKMSDIINDLDLLFGGEE